MSASASPGAKRRTSSDPLDYAMSMGDKDVLTLVREALADDRARLAYQPVFTVASEPRIAFHEGLIRVLDPHGRVIPAREFMGAIGKADIGRDIDCASLRLGFQMLRENPSRRLSINTSARSIADGRWRAVMEEGLASDPGAAQRLILEIGEDQAMLLPEVVIRFMEDMQPYGVAFALDDFGGGMTAFRHLKDFFFDLVKIDSCFVRGIGSDPDNQVLVQALTTVAHQFEMFAVANGVETPEEANLLARIGLDCLQGYHFGVPKFSL